MLACGSSNTAPVPAANPDTPTQYFIEGEEVDRATFDSRVAEYSFEAEPIETESVLNSDGSYGGSGATYIARGLFGDWAYTVVTFNEEDGSVHQSRSLRSR